MADEYVSDTETVVFQGLYTDDDCELVAVIDRTLAGSSVTISGPMTMDMLERNLGDPDQYGLSKGGMVMHNKALESMQDFLAEGKDPASLSHWTDAGNENAEPNQECHANPTFSAPAV